MRLPLPRGLAARRPGPNGRHRQIERWDRVVKWTCAGFLVVIMIVTVVTVGWWAWFLMMLALAVGLVGLSVTDAS